MKHKGFMLVEALVSISIVLMVVTVAMSTIVIYTNSARVNQDRTIATYLAIDAVEYIRQIKDSNAIRKSRGQNADFLDRISDECIDHPSDPCFVDTSVVVTSGASSLVNVCDFPNCTLRFNLPRGYQYTSGQPTKYTREIYITEQSPNHVTVSVHVNWLDKGQPFSVKINGDLYDW